MHKEILTKNQLELLSLIKLFSKDFILVGGTAIALYLGHRRSIDFDLFSSKPLKRRVIKKIIEEKKYSTKDILYEAYDQMHLVVNSVKMTFFQFPHSIAATQKFGTIISIPSLLDLAAMKAYALGGRAKWKDYVDLYFIMKDHHRYKEIAHRAKILFKTFFNEKLFREQLCYFKDIDYTESIEFYKNDVPQKEIKELLTTISISPF